MLPLCLSVGGWELSPNERAKPCDTRFASAATRDRSPAKGKIPAAVCMQQGGTFLNTKQLCTNSALAALCAVLGYFSISTGNFKLSFETLPIIIGALVMGPLSGAAVGLCGTFVYQLLRYGLMPTTPLWMLPYCVCGLIAGFAAKAGGYKLGRKKTVLLCVIAELAVTTLNTGVLYIDSRVYGYTVAYVFATIIPRYAVCVVKAVAEGFLLPPIVNALSRFGAAKGGVRNDG